jgi:hypothetical protein
MEELLSAVAESFPLEKRGFELVLLNTIAAVVAALGAIAAAIAAILAIKPAQRAAKAAEEQANVQRELMYQSAQPYVWADIQPDVQQGTMLHLVLGNAGPTVARNVRVVIDPPFPQSSGRVGRSAVAQRRLREGVLSLAPGRIIRWSLGMASDLMEDEGDTTVYRVRVMADGPYGEIEPVETEICLSDWRESLDTPEGSLHHIRKSIDKLVSAIESLKNAVEH